MPDIKHATDATLGAFVLKSSRPVVVDSWAVRCGPCQVVAPEREKLAAKHDGVIDVVKVDADANPGVPRAFGMMSTPTVALHAPGQQPQAVPAFRRAADLEAAFGLNALAPKAA